jgi:hypothetical protein
MAAVATEWLRLDCQSHHPLPLLGVAAAMSRRTAPSFAVLAVAGLLGHGTAATDVEPHVLPALVQSPILNSRPRLQYKTE